MLETVLEDYGVRGEITAVKPGPVVTLYGLEPEPGLQASGIIGLAGETVGAVVLSFSRETAIEIVSEAERDADIIRGESDAERNSILADAFTKDQEFFLFLRSMQAYKTSLTGDNATLMVEPDSEFFDYLSSPSGRPAVAPDPAESGAGGNG